jgi:NhaP-type Na+/H+ or K+/H+ antiporter
VGGAGGWVLRQARRRGFAAEDFAGIAVLALALLAYAAALALQGNGFVAAFCGGLAFGALAGRRAPAELLYLEQTGSVLSLLVWLAFGAIATPIMLDRSTVLFVGWFGPHGLASLVFALLALEALGSVADEAVALVAVTVLLSVVVHGLSASPLAGRYRQAAAAAGPEPGGPAPVPRVGGRLDH